MPDVLITIIEAVVGVICAYVLYRAKSWLDDKKLDALVNESVRAAEQTLKDDDPTGQKRKEYVVGLLRAAGHALTAWLDAKIEAAVYSVNASKKG